MQKKQTSPSRTGLSAIQHDALRLLASGCTAKYTALVLRLKYATVRKWLKQDVQFQTELNTLLDRQRALPPDITSKAELKEKRPDKKKRVNTAV